MSDFTFGAVSYVEPVGQDGEYADFDNPRGYIFGERYYVMAEDRAGYRMILLFAFTSQDEAGRFAHTLADDAPKSADWDHVDPSYGSIAYQREGIEEQRWMEERMEAHYGEPG